MIEILMASFNGEKYIRRQLDSIINQTCQDWQLVIRDDASNDQTVSIIEEYREKFPAKIRYTISQKRAGGNANFMKLVSESQAEYVMFCDQDDIWHPDKIEKTWQRMRTEEKQSKGPILVFTDAVVTDGEGKMIASSFSAYQKIDPNSVNLGRLVTGNAVTGCTIMMNRQLAALIRYRPELIIHDWTCALIACLCGRLVYLDETLLDYCQHSGNQVGAHNARSLSFWARKVQGIERQKDLIRASSKQASTLAMMLEGKISDKDHELLTQYGKLLTQKGLKRLQLIRRYHLGPVSFLKKWSWTGLVICMEDAV